MPQKHSFVVYSGNNGNADASRVYHAMAHAKQVHDRGDIAKLYFAGEGTYWPGALADKAHSMNTLFNDLQDRQIIVGACQNCAVAFGHKDSAAACVGLVQGPEASYGQIDIIGMEDEGFRVWTF